MTGCRTERRGTDVRRAGGMGALCSARWEPPMSREPKSDRDREGCEVSPASRDQEWAGAWDTRPLSLRVRVRRQVELAPKGIGCRLVGGERYDELGPTTVVGNHQTAQLLDAFSYGEVPVMHVSVVPDVGIAGQSCHSKEGKTRTLAARCCRRHERAARLRRRLRHARASSGSARPTARRARRRDPSDRPLQLRLESARVRLDLATMHAGHDGV